MTVAAVGVSDQSGATALPWAPSGWEFRMWGYSSPQAEGLCAGAPPGGDPCHGQGGAPADCLLPLVLKAK